MPRNRNTEPKRSEFIMAMPKEYECISPCPSKAQYIRIRWTDEMMTGNWQCTVGTDRIRRSIPPQMAIDAIMNAGLLDGISNEPRQPAKVELSIAAANKVQAFLGRMHRKYIDTFGVTSIHATQFCEPFWIMKSAIRAAKGRKKS